jgi:hypothetical protein
MLLQPCCAKLFSALRYSLANFIYFGHLFRCTLVLPKIRQNAAFAEIPFLFKRCALRLS